MHLGQIDRQDGFKLEANIDERYISRVYVGQPAEFEFRGKVYPLSVDKIYTDVTNGSFQVDLLFDEDTPDHIKKRPDTANSFNIQFRNRCHYC